MPTPPPSPAAIQVVALAGTLCSPGIFDPLADRLAGIATVEALSWMTWPGPWDLGALGERVAAHIRSGDRRPVLLVGHSTGGAIALQVALQHPDLVAALALIDSGPNMHAHGDVDAIVQRMSTSWNRALFGAVLDRSFAEPLDPVSRDRFLEYADGVPQAAGIEVLTSQRATDFLPRLGELELPTLVIHGEDDPTRTVEQATAFASAIPSARLALLPSGHSPMYERPDETAALLARLAAQFV